MAKRRIDTIWNGNVKIRVYRDSEWQEYSCVLVIDGIVQDAATYYTDDKEDAISTASDMLNRAYMAVKTKQMPTLAK